MVERDFNNKLCLRLETCQNCDLAEGWDVTETQIRMTEMSEMMQIDHALARFVKDASPMTQFSNTMLSLRL